MTHRVGHTHLTCGACSIQPFLHVLWRALGFSKNICFAFNPLWGCRDRCYTHGKDRSPFLGEAMLNFGKTSEKHPPCGIGTSYLLCLFHTTFSYVLRCPLGFSIHNCLAFNGLRGWRDRCYTNAKDHMPFLDQNMPNFGKQVEMTHPVGHTHLTCCACSIPPFPHVLWCALGFSKHICFAFKALPGWRDRCCTNAKDHMPILDQNMLNFGKHGQNDPPCGTDTFYLMCLFNATFPQRGAAPPTLFDTHLLSLQCHVGMARPVLYHWKGPQAIF